MPHKSVLSDVDIPEEDLITFLFKNVKDHEDNVAFVEDDTQREITYKDLYKSLRCVASALHSKGFQQRDVLCIYASERIDWVVTAFAVVALGGTFSGCNARYPPAELLRHIETSQPKFLVCSTELLDSTRNMMKQYTKFKEVFVFGEAVDGFTPFNELLQHEDKLSDLNVKFDPINDIASISFSSGTTGTPKGVMIRHRSLVGNACQNSHPDVARLHGSKGVFTGDVPLLHLAGQTLLLTQPVHLGAKTILISMHSDINYKFERFLKAVVKHKISVVHFLPHMGNLLLKHESVDRTDLSSITSIRMCGAPLGAAVQQQVTEKLPKSIHIGNLYGTTEAMVISWTLHTRKIKPGSVGMLLPNVQAKIMDVSTHQELTEPNAKGEIYLKTPSLFGGYLGRPDLTSIAVDDEGYYHTGDIGYFDEDEYFYIIDRIKDVMFYNGSNIWPSDLEDLIKCLPDVADVGVIGIPHPPDDLPKAFVVKKPGSSLTEEDIITYVKENVASERYLRGGVEFIDSIPRTLSGKILRKNLKEL